MKKITARSLTVLLLASILLTAASCADNGAVAQTAATQAEVSQTEAVTTEEPKDSPAVMNADYGGAVFNVLYPDWSLYKSFYNASEETGDFVNDAIFMRTQKLEEALNIDFQWMTKGFTGTIFNETNKAVMAGEDAYQLVLTHCIEDLPAIVSGGVFIDWNDIPNIDMSKDYWNQTIADTMEINGVLPFNANAFILPDVNSIFFNTSMITDYSLDDPYQLVLDGKWTLDNFTALAATVSEDIDGDGQMTEADRYGFVGELDWQFASVLTSCGVNIVSIDESGMPYFDFNNDKTVTLTEKFTSMKTDKTAFFWNYNQSYDPNHGGTPPVDFNKGNALFYLVPLSFASNFRSVDADFGILPIPKYDEAQQDYASLDWAGFMFVPSSVADVEMVGSVVEMLGYLNKQYVMPAFYDVLLGQKISRDDVSTKMLDITFSSARHDLGVNLGYAYVMSDCMKGKPFASYYEQNIKQWQASLDKYFKAHEEYAALHG